MKRSIRTERTSSLIQKAAEIADAIKRFDTFRGIDTNHTYFIQKVQISSRGIKMSGYDLTMGVEYPSIEETLIGESALSIQESENLRRYKKS
jgi:hypothetical protein